MEVDCYSSQPDQQQHGLQQHHQDQQQQRHCAAGASAFAAATSVQHLCNHTCSVTHELGNLYRCASSGLLHVCDATCDKRVYVDSYSSICLLSRKLHPPLEEAPARLSKRGSWTVDQEQEGSAAAGGSGSGPLKRFNSGCAA